MLVVSDTSPIMNLASVGKFELLEKMYGELLVPDAVFEELKAMDKKDIIPITLFVLIERKSVSNRALVNRLLSGLHPGEAEAIALAVEQKADLLLIDERRGRNEAKMLGLNVLGLLGVLIDAKRRGLIARVKPVLDELISEAGFWISTNLYSEVIQAAGE